MWSLYTVYMHKILRIVLLVLCRNVFLECIYLQIHVQQRADLGAGLRDSLEK